MIQTRFSVLRFLRRIMIFRFAFWRNWKFCVKQSWDIENNLDRYIKRVGTEENFLDNISDHLRVLYL